MTRGLPYAIAIIFAFTALTVARTLNVTEPFPENGVLNFPSVDGISGRLFLRLMSSASNGTSLIATTTTAVSTLPIAAHPRQPSRLVVAFTIQVSEPIHAVTFPQWRIDVPREMALKPPYGVEVFVARSGETQSRESYAARAQGSMIVTGPRTCPIPAANGVKCASEQYVPGSIYIFEILQNPPLSQVPRPFIPH